MIALGAQVRYLGLQDRHHLVMAQRDIRIVLVRPMSAGWPDPVKILGLDAPVAGVCSLSRKTARADGLYDRALGQANMFSGVARRKAQCRRS